VPYTRRDLHLAAVEAFERTVFGLGLIKRFLPRGREEDGVDQDEARGRGDDALRDELFDALVGLLAHPSVDRHSGLLGGFDEVHETHPSAVVLRQSVEEGVEELVADLPEERVRHVEDEWQGRVLAGGRLRAARELEVEPVERDVQPLLAELEAHRLRHLGLGRSTRTYPRHRERDRQTVRRKEEVLAGFDDLPIE
jgi:hypothetical protein